jgi:hypothetical protein
LSRSGVHAEASVFSADDEHAGRRERLEDDVVLELHLPERLIRLRGSGEQRDTDSEQHGGDQAAHC